MSISDTVRRILEAEAEAIRGVPVTPEFDRAVAALHETDRKVLTTGMGKAGHVARKFAATLSSTGTPAVYIHPGEAMHGDLGIVQPGDCMVAFSTSGKTREVISTVRQARALKLGTVIGVTSHRDSELRTLSQILLDMGDIPEPCPLGLTPTASTAAMMAIADALALCVMDLRGFTRRDFGSRHHGGYLGVRAYSDAVD